MRSKQLGRIIFTAALSLASGFASAVIVPDPPQVAAKGYVLMDYQSGEVIASSNENDRLAPASLTKIMTSYVIGQEMKSGRIAMDDVVTVSENAWARNFPGSSLMFIKAGDKISLADLNRGLVIQSGNDAAVALAEHIAGSEGAFVQLMNSWAQQLGMNNSLFTNAHGLDGDGKYTTPMDMALLSQALIRDVPDEYVLYKEKKFTWGGISQSNRNKLLWDRNLNVDGMKTGYTPEAGYSLITSATEGEMRLISVVMGTRSEKARLEESRKLLQYGFRFFETTQLLVAEDTLKQATIWMGTRDSIRAGVEEDVFITLADGLAKDLEVDYQINPELKAPVNAGDVIGLIQWTVNDDVVKEQPLLALESVEQGGLFKRLLDQIRLFFSSIISQLFG